MTNYQNFRQRLDAVLRTRDVERVREFLIAEGQWDEGVPADPSFAMWMMIAASPTLKELHPQALAWLNSNGHSSEAQAVSGKSSSSPRTSSGTRSSNATGRSAYAPKSKRSAPPRSNKQR
ncbi:hypothetical protein [Dictyobacter arantiisoli]|uniref:Uncharacterized protein n=1 Tax=Dictyobacter arantiisoli TaxID=2014874 RepID=A0A5A5T8T2_9CHLR|nr:hypothetical protein [Dictyobacter arantiisoli]GCF07822.1 hypothetical protein KDI_13860 [Dictyobacter arantiisoli]